MELPLPVVAKCKCTSQCVRKATVLVESVVLVDSIVLVDSVALVDSVVLVDSVISLFLWIISTFYSHIQTSKVDRVEI